MTEMIVGPWSLKEPYGKKLFDIQGFVRDAEAGKYDRAFACYGMDRSAPWYQQLKRDVQDGLYDPDRPDVEERHEQAVRTFLEDDGNMVFAFSEEDAWIAAEGAIMVNNLWVDMARVTCTYGEAFPIDRNSVILVKGLVKDPERGWRK